MSSKRELLVNAIEDMLNGNINEEYAICCNLDNNFDITLDAYKFVEIFSKGWDKHSGDVNYPVGNSDIWGKCLEDETFWEGEQRELRFSLLEHLKSELLRRTDEEVEELLG